MDSPATTEPQDGCPHCGHGWASHADRTWCHCGCMWQPTPPQPTPPTAEELLIARIEDVIWMALEEQDGPYVDREMDMVDASGAGLNMAAVAAAVLAALNLTEEYGNSYEKQGDGGVWRDERTGPLHKSLADANVRMQQQDPVGFIRNMRLACRLVGPWQEEQK